MDPIQILESEKMGHDFIPRKFLPRGKDEYYLRDLQSAKKDRVYRQLTALELEQLVKNGNVSDNWDEMLVSDPFDPGLFLNSKFYGRVRIGILKPVILEHHDLRIPVGIVNSTVIACDIGDDVAIHHVRYLAHYIIGNRSILLNIDEMHTTNHAKFGNGIIKEGESEKVRIWLDLMNETGCRSVAPFDGMIPADAYLWAKYRDDSALQKALLVMTQKQADSRRGYYGTVGDQCIIKNSGILKDVKIGSGCYIKGANKLKNLTINSSLDEQTQIGEGVELVNGIVGFGCHIFYGVKAVRFILGNQANLKYGARLIHSFLGPNSTISCCEVLNNLIFPAHEQHHNNSFLIASLIMGQSNLAAGATIGSNHNSRANDNEVQAGRGFWPGLCTSVKHSCRFASFILLSKGDYPSELDIPLPFSLLNNNTALDRLELMPAFWWLFNMYALARNTWKFKSRDKRKVICQNIEFEALAPDTVEEIIQARTLLETWTGKTGKRHDKNPDHEGDLAAAGRSILSARKDGAKDLEVFGECMEKSRRKVLILKPREAYEAYGQMLLYYGVKNVMQYMEEHTHESFKTMSGKLNGDRQTRWINMGGQLIPEPDVDRLREDIGKGKINSWHAVHEFYNRLWAAYPIEKQKHAYAVLCGLLGKKPLTQSVWIDALDQAVTIQEIICDRVYESRQKDYDNPFRRATFRNHEEMLAVLGTADKNSFILQVREETEIFKKRVTEIKKRSA